MSFSVHDIPNLFILFSRIDAHLKVIAQKVSEYDQEMTPSQTADKPVAS